MIIVFILITILPLLEHFLIMFAGISLFSIFGLTLVEVEQKRYQVLLVALSLILDITFIFAFGSYLFSFSISYVLYLLLSRLLSQENTAYYLITRYLFFSVNFVLRELLFRAQNGGGINFSEINYVGLLLPALISTVLYLLINYFQKQLRGEAGVLKLK